MSRNQKLGVAAVALVLCVGAFLFAVDRMNLREDEADPGPGAPVERPTVIGEGAEIVLRHVMDQGDEAGVEVMQASEELVGLSLAEVSALRPSWRIRSFSPERIVADVPCAPGAGGFLAEREGRVAIFDGTPAGCHRLREVTTISVDHLSPEAREALVSGITFAGDEDLPQLLEGLLGEV